MVDVSISSGNLVLHVGDSKNVGIQAFAWNPVGAHKRDQGRLGDSARLVARNKNARHQHSRSADGRHFLAGRQAGFVGCPQP